MEELLKNALLNEENKYKLLKQMQLLHHEHDTTIFELEKFLFEHFDELISAIIVDATTSICVDEDFNHYYSIFDHLFISHQEIFERKLVEVNKVVNPYIMDFYFEVLSEKERKVIYPSEMIAMFENALSMFKEEYLCFQTRECLSFEKYQHYSARMIMGIPRYFSKKKIASQEDFLNWVRTEPNDYNDFLQRSYDSYVSYMNRFKLQCK